MKPKFKLLCAALLMLAALGSRAQCGGPFMAYVESGGVVQFQDSANMNLEVTWNFGDGDTANNSNFQVWHTYAQSGSYYVSATVTNPSVPCTTTYYDTVVINLCSGLAGFGTSQTGFGTYSFNAYVNAPGVGYLWNFGDGSPSSTAVAPTHNFTASGLYTLSLVVYDTIAGCHDTSSWNLGVTLCSFANNFSYDSLGPNPYTFIVSSPVPGYTYTWNFGDGTTGSGDTAVHTFTHYAQYTSCLITSDATTGCSDSSCQNEWVDPCDIYTYAYASNNGLIASFGIGFARQANNQSGLTYSWSFPGGLPSTATTSSATVNYSTSGTYTATVTVTSPSSCADTLTQTVTITSITSYFGITGTVNEGNNPACGNVYLIAQDTTGHLALIDSIVNTPVDTVINGTTTILCSGQFQFWGLPIDTYYVKAALNSGDPDYANYLPTYYGDVLHWASATPVILSNANASIGIDLELGSNPGGPGFVSGWITQGAGLVYHPGGGGNIVRGAGDRLAGIQVNLLTANNDPVAYTYSDVNGDYQFNNLALGSYKIYIEQLNKAVVPDTFTLTAQNPTDTTIAITDDSPNSFATSVNDLSGVSISGVFPNPVSTLLDVVISSKQPAEATLSLNDVLGQTVAIQKLHLANGLNKGEINMEDLAPGVYEVVVQSNNERLAYKVIKAK